MIQRQPPVVFMEDAKRWTGHIAIGGDTEATGNCLGQGGFSGAEIAIETDHIPGHGQFAETVAEGLGLGQGIQGKAALAQWQW